MAGFIFPHTDAPKTHPILPFPIRIRQKPARFYTQTAVEGFFGAYAIRPYTDTCKIWRVLGLNLRRETFGGVCFCALHGYVQNLTGFIFPHPDTPKNAPGFTFPNKDTYKTRPVLDPNLRRKTFRGICFFALHGHVQNLAGFIFPHTDTPKNAPDFTLSNKDIPKSCPVLDPNLWRGTFSGRIQYAPTRVRAKFDGFHISARGYAKSAPDFTFPNRDTPKTRSVLYSNLWRGVFRAYAFAPLHGYMQIPPDFRPKPSARIVWGRMQYAPTRVHEKPVRFHISSHGYVKNAPDFTIPNRDTPKTRSILDPNLRRGLFRGVCNTPLHGYMKNLAGFRPKFLSQDILGRMQYAPTRVRAKSVRFHISPHGYTKNAPDFRRKPSARDISGRMLLRPYTGMCIIHPVSYSRTRIHQKCTRFHIFQ